MNSKPTAYFIVKVLQYTSFLVFAKLSASVLDIEQYSHYQYILGLVTTLSIFHFQGINTVHYNNWNLHSFEEALDLSAYKFKLTFVLLSIAALICLAWNTDVSIALLVSILFYALIEIKTIYAVYNDIDNLNKLNVLHFSLPLLLLLALPFDSWLILLMYTSLPTLIALKLIVRRTDGFSLRDLNGAFVLTGSSLILGFTGGFDRIFLFGKIDAVMFSEYVFSMALIRQLAQFLKDMFVPYLDKLRSTGLPIYFGLLIIIGYLILINLFPNILAFLYNVVTPRKLQNSFDVFFTGLQYFPIYFIGTYVSYKIIMDNTKSKIFINIFQSISGLVYLVGIIALNFIDVETKYYCTIFFLKDVPKIIIYFYDRIRGTVY